MKTGILALAAVVLSTSAALARGGNGFGPGDNLVAESIEKSARLAQLQGLDLATAQVAGRQVSPERAEVVFTFANGTSAAYDCSLIDDVSKGGTRIKKEVVCVRR
jgi:hypothetical protein